MTGQKDAVSTNDALFNEVGLSTQWLLRLIATHCAPDFRVKFQPEDIVQVYVRRISTGKGFLSKAYKVSITCKDGSTLPQLVLKLPCTDALEEADANAGGKVAQLSKSKRRFEMIKEMHNRECDFYEIFRNASGVPISRTFYGQKFDESKRKAFILLEYLGESANLKDSLSKDQLESLLDIVAGMQCHALLHQDLWKGRYEPLNVAEMEKSRLRMAAYVFRMIRVSKFRLVPYLWRLRHVLKNNKFMDDLLVAHRVHGIHDVLCHGDFYTNNFILGKDGSIRGIIDGQLMNSGNPIQDIARCLAFGVDAPQRRIFELHVLKQYHLKLSGLLEQNGLKSPYTLEQLHVAYRSSFVRNAISCLWMVAVLPTNGAENKQRMRRFLRRTIDALDDAICILREDYANIL